MSNFSSFFLIIVCFVLANRDSCCLFVSKSTLWYLPRLGGYQQVGMAVVDRLLLVAGLSAEGLLCFSTDSPCDAQRCASEWEMHMGSQKGPRTSKPVVIGVSFLISFISFVFMDSA